MKSVEDGWETGWKDDELYPQQSVSKLWVAITALDAVDRGKISLGDKVTLTRKDLTVFHQPIRDEILKNGSYTTTIDDLMVRQITTSDNTANDRLMRFVGGPKAVRAMIARKHLGAIRFANGERAMQSKIAGLNWSPEYSYGHAFWEARDKVPIKKRSAAFAHYIASPYDGAAPSAVVGALARLSKGRLAVALLDRSAAQDHGQHPHRAQSAQGRARAGMDPQPQDRDRAGARRSPGRL